MAPQDQDGTIVLAVHSDPLGECPEVRADPGTADIAGGSPCRLSSRPGRLVPGGLGAAGAGGLDGGSECLPANTAEGQCEAAAVFAVADLDGAGAGVPGFDAVAAVRVGVAALGPGAGKGHRGVSFIEASSPRR